MAREIYLICDECGKRELEGVVNNWLSVSPPAGTKFTFNGIERYYYGLFCSIECLEKRIEQVRNPQSTFIGGALIGKWGAIRDEGGILFKDDSKEVD